MKIFGFSYLLFLVTIASRGVFVHLDQPEGPLKLHYDVPDSFKVWQAFPYAVAVSDSNHDRIMECTEATRTALDPATSSVSYDFRIPNTGETIPFHLKAAEAPGSATYTDGSDTKIGKSQYYYTDYDSCVIHVLDYKDGRCFLWLSKKAMAEVPKACVDHFEDTCGVVAPSGRGDLCPTA